MTRQKTCAEVKRAIRAQLAEGFGDTVRFDVRSAPRGLVVIIPDHRANGVAIPRHRVELDDVGRLVNLAASHFLEYVPAAVSVG